MRIAVSSLQGEVFLNFEVENNEIAENVKALIEVEVKKKSHFDY